MHIRLTTIHRMSQISTSPTWYTRLLGGCWQKLGLRGEYPSYVMPRIQIYFMYNTLITIKVYPYSGINTIGLWVLAPDWPAIDSFVESTDRCEPPGGETEEKFQMINSRSVVDTVHHPTTQK